MKYRMLGNTGLKVSEIGYGGEHLLGRPFELIDAVVNTAIDGGVNIMDLFMPQPQLRSHIGRAIGKRRKNVMLQGHIGTAIQSDGQYLRTRDPKICDEFVRDFLTRYDTDYIDFGMIHYVDTEDEYKSAFDTPYIEYIHKLKKDGVIRFVGASTHDAATAIKMVNTGFVDMIMFSINPVYDLCPNAFNLNILSDHIKLEKLEIDPERMELYNLCAAKGVGITVMKALGAGRLLNADITSLASALTLNQCISYALDRPAVSSVILGAETVAEMEQSIAYTNASPEEKNYMASLQSGLPMIGKKCMYCNHCLPCPQGIDVAAVTKYLDIATISNNDLIRDHYRGLTAHGSDCVECGSCEKNCPFNINVIENMKEAVRVFGTSVG